MRTVGFVGLAVAICLAAPVEAQTPVPGLRSETAPFAEHVPNAVPAGIEGSSIDARAHGAVGTDTSVTFAGRRGLQASRERGDDWRRKGDFEQAIAEYTRALEISARDPESFFGRGRSYHEAGNIGKAIDDYNEAARLQPRWSDVYKLRAHARFAQGSLDLAMADLRRAIEYDPKDVDYLTALGLLRLYTGDNDVARSNLSRALQFKEDPEAMLLLYIARTQNGEEATKELEAGASRLRSKAWPFPLVELYLGKRSVSDVLAAARTDSERCEAQYYSGQLLLLGRSKAAALAAFKQAALVCPKTYLEYGAAAAELKRHRR